MSGRRRKFSLHPSKLVTTCEFVGGTRYHLHSLSTSRSLQCPCSFWPTKVETCRNPVCHAVPTGSYFPSPKALEHHSRASWGGCSRWKVPGSSSASAGRAEAVLTTLSARHQSGRSSARRGVFRPSAMGGGELQEPFVRC